MDIILKPKHVTIFFSFIVVCLTLAHIAGQCSVILLKDENIFQPLVPLFDLDLEQNFPTFYSSVSLLFCSFLLLIITFAKRNSGERYLYWLGLAAIFLFLSADESIMIHERLGWRVRSALNTSGYLFYAWTIIYGIALIIFLLVYAKFIFNLPLRTRFLFIIAGSIYVLAAIGVELIEGRLLELYGENIISIVFRTIQELFEMTGIVVFIYALTSYIDSELKDLQLSIKSSN